MADIYTDELLAEAVNLYWGGPFWGNPRKIEDVAKALSRNGTKVSATLLWKKLKAKHVPLRQSGEDPYMDEAKRKLGLSRVWARFRPLTEQQRRVLLALMTGMTFTRRSLRDKADVESAASRVSDLILIHGVEIRKEMLPVDPDNPKSTKVMHYTLVDFDKARELLSKEA